MNIVQKAISWFLQKAVGFPAWNVASQPPQVYSRFFSATNGNEALEKLSTVYTCCNLLGRLVSTFPIDIVESDGQISQPVDNYIAGLLAQPNEYMNRVVFMETMLLNFNLYGNAYAEIVRMGNFITALWPLPFQRVRPQFKNQVLTYDISMPDGSTAVLRADQVLKFQNFSLDGINGLTPIQLYAVRKNIGAEEFQANFLKNGARPSIAFTTPEKPSKEAQDRLRETGERLYSGPENAGRILFLFGSMDVKTISISPQDAQLIETMKMGKAEIAAAYGVTLNQLNESDKTATYASAESFKLTFVEQTLRPLCIRIATALKESLLNPRSNLSVKFNLDALLEGNPIDKANYLRTLVAGGMMTPNEARAKLNLPPAPGGDELVIQSNMTLLDLLEEIANRAPAAAPSSGMNGNGNGNNLNGSKAKHFLPAWR